MPSLAETPEMIAAARFIELKVEQKALQARLDWVKDQIKAMQPALIAYLSAAGLQSITLNGYLLSPRREPWIYPMTGVSRQRVCEALKMAGLSRMVNENYSTQSLTKYVKELEERSQLIVGFDGDAGAALGQLLHPALAELLHVQASYTLQVKKKEQPFERYTPYERDEDDEQQATEP